MEITRDSGATGDAAGVVVVFNNDLFFGVKIGNTLRQLGYVVRFVKNDSALTAAMEHEPITLSLVVVDMGVSPDWETVKSVTASPNSPPVLVFGSHLDVNGFRAAKAAGVRRVVSNGDFHRDMVELVRRYARQPIVEAGEDAAD